MDRTARRRATHHVAAPADPDPADLRGTAAAHARTLVALLSSAPDALSAERLVSDLAAHWSGRDVARVALAIETEEPTDLATAALHAVGWTLDSAEARAFADLRGEEGQLSPPWTTDLLDVRPTGATGLTGSGERIAFVAFDGAHPHVLAVGTFAGRRAHLGLLHPEATLPEAEPLELADAAGLLATALGPTVQCGHDGLPDLRHLARRRLELLASAE